MPENGPAFAERSIADGHRSLAKSIGFNKAQAIYSRQRLNTARRTVEATIGNLASTHAPATQHVSADRPSDRASDFVESFALDTKPKAHPTTDSNDTNRTLDNIFCSLGIENIQTENHHGRPDQPAGEADVRPPRQTASYLRQRLMNDAGKPTARPNASAPFGQQRGRRRKLIAARCRQRPAKNVPNRNGKGPRRPIATLLDHEAGSTGEYAAKLVG